MEPKLILIEGLPGTEKSIVARNVKQQLEEQGKRVIYYAERATHPANMAWQAYLTREEYHRFIADCLTVWLDSGQSISDDELVRRIEAQCQNDGDHVIMAYRNINWPDHSYEKLVNEIAKKDFFGGKVSFQKFRELHLRRWSNFAKNAQVRKEVVIFEGAFLQSQLFEMICFLKKSDEEILDYLVELMNTVMFLEPRLIYVMTKNVGTMVDAVMKMRKNENPDKDWFTVMERWVRETSYGKELHMSGCSGIVKLLEERQRLDYLALKKIGIPVTWMAKEL